MWLELGTMIISTMLTVAGIGLPQVNLDAAATTPAALCMGQSADTCMQSDMCDVFIASGGAEVCSLACDMRGLDTCLMDTNCTVSDGVCDYADHSPVGC